jgi:predicted Fe-Mo cluster-binding NifX family protein
MKRIAIPVNGNQLSPHFGHCEKFGIFDIEDNRLVSETLVPAPPHEPGLLPKWLAAKGVNEIIAGGMGQRAIQLFEQHNVTVNLGVRAQGDYQSIVDQYIRQTLETGDNSCDH